MGRELYRDPTYCGHNFWLHIRWKNLIKGKNEIEDVGVFFPHEILYDDMAFDHGDVLKEFVGSSKYKACRKENRR